MYRRVCSGDVRCIKGAGEDRGGAGTGVVVNLMEAMEVLGKVVLEKIVEFLRNRGK